MYRLKPGIKSDPVRRWSLPERVFFACGACHILAHAFLDRFPDAGYAPRWIRPVEGFSGNHIVAWRAADDMAFDYHGHVPFARLLAHMRTKARRWWPGWDCTLEDLPPALLVSERLSRTRPGLWLREPGQFLHDATPRAKRYLDRFAPPPALRDAAAESPLAMPGRAVEDRTRMSTEGSFHG